MAENQLTTVNTTDTNSNALQPVTEQAQPLQPVNEPTLNDFILEAQKLGQQKFQSQADIAAQKIPEYADALSRRLISQNVGAASGAGQQLQQRAIGEFQDKLIPFAQQAGAETAQQELQIRQQERSEARVDADRQAQEQFNLVQSGQITGEEAQRVLIERGINPENFLTPQALQDQQFQTLLEQSIQDPTIRETINNQDELNFFFETGKTFEDEIADIMRTKKDLAGWKEKMPFLQQQLEQYNTLINDELNKNSGWVESIFGGGRNDENIAQWREQLAAIEQAINEINAGKVPVLAIGE